MAENKVGILDGFDFMAESMIGILEGFVVMADSMAEYKIGLLDISLFFIHTFYCNEAII